MASGESVNCEETDEKCILQWIWFTICCKRKKKKIEFSNWICGKRGWQIKSNFLGVKHGKSSRLKKGENDSVN